MRANIIFRDDGDEEKHDQTQLNDENNSKEDYGATQHEKDSQDEHEQSEEIKAICYYF